MTFDKIIVVVNDIYGRDDMIYQYYDDPDGMHGDTLAKFIFHELHDTYDEDADDAEQIEEAIRVIHRGKEQLEEVVVALRQLHVSS